MPATKPSAAMRPLAPTPEPSAEFLDDAVVEVAAPDPVLEGDDAGVLEPVEPVVPDEFEDAGGVPSAEDALAVAWNASNVLFAVGLMANTMPCSQWPVCWQ